MKLKEQNWTILDSTYIIKKPWCTTRVDHVKLPSGVEIPEYYVLEYPNWANVIAITKDRKFVMVRQYRHGVRKRSYELPAGVCDPTDPTPMHSAKRELLEETGYGNGRWQELTVISANPGTHNNYCFCYLATNVEKVSDQHLEETEDLEIAVLSLEEVKHLLINDEIKQAMHAAPLWKYMALNKLI